MKKYSEIEQKKIILTFETLNHNNIEYVITHGFSNLPQFTLGGDIDVLIDEKNFNKVLKIMEENGFKEKSNNHISQVKRMVKYGIESPAKIFPKLYKKSINYFFNNSKNNKIIQINNLEYKFYFNNVMFHLVNQISYKTTLANSNKQIIVSDLFKKSFLKNKQKMYKFYVTDKTENLVHLINRGVFDKDGFFPDYYITRCEELYRDIKNNKKKEKYLNYLLSLIYYNGASVVYKNIKRSRYNEIKEDLLKFSNY